MSTIPLDANRPTKGCHGLAMTPEGAEVRYCGRSIECVLGGRQPAHDSCEATSQGEITIVTGRRFR